MGADGERREGRGEAVLPHISFIMAATIITRSFRCLRAAERAACKDMADASISMSAFVPVATVDAHWSVYPASARPIYIAVWKDQFNVSTGSVSILGVPTTVYLANQAWMTQLETKLLTGCLSLADPPCQIQSFPSPADPDCIYS